MEITIADGRGALWQWDTGRRVKITDGNGVKQIHYQNKCFGRSVDVDVGDDGTAIIPDELLQDWHPLTAYAYVTDGTGAYTMVQQDFAVHKRAKPADYVYTPTEHAGFDRLRAEIGDLADLTTAEKDTLVAAINEAAKSGGIESIDLRVADGYIQYSTDVLRRAVRVALTKCTSSNPRVYVIDGQSYCTAITADTGCEVSNVKIMMGGEDVSTFYKDGVIAIPEVIGDIVITATAVAQAPAYTNLLDAAIDMDGNVIGHTPMYKNMRYNSSSGAPVAHSGTNITGLLPVKKGDVVRIRWKGNTDISYQSIKFFKSDRTQVKVGYTSLAYLEKGQEGPVINFNAANGVADFKFDSSNGAAYFSIVLYDTLENVIVTTNEEII